MSRMLIQAAQQHRYSQGSRKQPAEGSLSEGVLVTST